ncbi:unnamed protein product [Polarella glacialis]|uniref:ABC transporter domain-containing protein n=1 Tax=Polarella glacialis TaxID=89957 RepID=A0A813L0J8_POLGL|nr:unnamed protein product [Polarella glacialis]
MKALRAANALLAKEKDQLDAEMASWDAQIAQRREILAELEKTVAELQKPDGEAQLDGMIRCAAEFLSGPSPPPQRSVPSPDPQQEVELELMRRVADAVSGCSAASQSLGWGEADFQREFVGNGSAATLLSTQFLAKLSPEQRLVWELQNPVEFCPRVDRQLLEDLRKEGSWGSEQRELLVAAVGPPTQKEREYRPLLWLQHHELDVKHVEPGAGGASLLALACRGGFCDVARALLERRADVALAGAVDVLALSATPQGQSSSSTKLLRLLLEFRADIDQEISSGRDALVIPSCIFLKSLVPAPCDRTMASLRSGPAETRPVKEKKVKGEVVDKPVLKDISGHASPGSFTVILGASGLCRKRKSQVGGGQALPYEQKMGAGLLGKQQGCRSGKTSLLSVLADRLLYSKGAMLTGDLRINGELTPADYRSRCAYVQQTEVFYPYSTVRETVEMAARLRLGSAVPKEAKIRRAAEVVQQLGLSKAMDTKVGNGNSVKGISGGEMKRVSIACELVSSPSLIMLDEPTSGLDSTAALNVVKGLQDLAAGGHTVIASIHQPGSAIYTLFGNVVVLAEGRLAYFGDAGGVVAHFSSIGYSCPKLFNPAEYVLQVTSVDFSSPEAEVESRKALLRIQENGKMTVRPARQVSSGLGHPIQTGTTLIEQFVLLYRRILLDALRNKSALIIKFVQGISTTLIMVALYSNLDGGGVVSITVANVGALLFFITINGLFGPLFGTIQAFAPEVNIVLRERMNNLYSMAPYYLAKLLVALPIELLPLVVGNTIAFWWLKLNHSVDHYIMFLLFTCGMTFASVGLGFLLAAATGGNIQAASAAVGPLALIMLLLGGFYINTSTIPVWIAWLGKISYVSWSYQGLAINQFRTISVGAPKQPDGSCMPDASPEQCLDGVKILGNLFNDGIPLSEKEWEDTMWSST